MAFKAYMLPPLLRKYKGGCGKDLGNFKFPCLDFSSERLCYCVLDLLAHGQLVHEVVVYRGALRQLWLRDGVQVVTEQARHIVVTVMKVSLQLS